MISELPSFPIYILSSYLWKF